MRRFDVETSYDTTVEKLWTLLQDAALLTDLTKFPKVTLLGDGASVQGNEVHLLVGVGPVQLRWDSLITVAGDYAFCDQGVKLPFPFKRFTHVHHVKQQNGRVIMRDEVTFESYVPNILVEKFVLRPMFQERARVFQEILNSQE